MSDLDFVLDTIDPWITKYLMQGAGALSPLEMIGVGVWMLEAEVNNGGFHQYYFNSSGELAIATVTALTSIGAPRTASLLMAANAEFPGSLPPVDRERRQRELDAMVDTVRFNALEEAFYQGDEDLTALLAMHFRNSKNESHSG
jgi:hypothetical protein